jgi:hypothetical protein
MAGENSMSDELAQALIRIGGSADPSDKALVVEQLSLFPVEILTRLKNDGTTIVVCRVSVTDYLTQLRGVQPRGWPRGSTWDSVPGVFYPETNEVVLAVVGHNTPVGPHMAATGEGQGSANVMLHESAHGVDMGDGTPFLSATPAFINARNADLNQLSSYERQPSPAGEEETFAESAARFYTGQDASMPNLHGYWASISSQLAQPPSGPPRHPSEDVPGATIGTASMSADRTITLQLRATGYGARGDALLLYRPDHPQYARILQHLGGLQPNESKHVPQFPVEP